MNLECPKCGHSWNYKGKEYRAMCMPCKTKHKRITWIKTGLPSKATTKYHQNTITSISDDMMKGSIVDALKEAGLDPLNSISPGYYLFIMLYSHVSRCKA